MTPFAGTNRVTSKTGRRTYEYPAGSGKTVTDTHQGCDIVPTRYAGEALPESAWQVRETTGGTVQQVGYSAARGHFVCVQSGPALVTTQHYKSVAVKPGQAVRQGHILGVAGSSGQSQAPHLHFEVHKNGATVSPAAWSGVPNAVGSYTGESRLDGQAAAAAPQGGAVAQRAALEKARAALASLGEALAVLAEGGAQP